MTESDDGQLFVKNLAHFIRTHERALANALEPQRPKPGPGKDAPSSASANLASTTVTLAQALRRPYLAFAARPVKPAKLHLTPHHLFYLLSKFEDLNVDVGSMTVRLENLHSHTTPANYVSFLGQAPKSKGKQTDADSIRSVSSMRSVMSSMSNAWSTITMSNPAARAEKQVTQYREDLRYLYSCFTKIPALRLAPDSRAKLISGFEEFPFDTAVPMFVFKNVSSLEVCDLDFRQFYGWDRMAEQLRSLTVKRAGVDDPMELLHDVILDDAEKRRKRSSRTHIPTTPSTPGISWTSGSPKFRQLDLARSTSSPGTPFVDQRRRSTGSPLILDRAGSSDGKAVLFPDRPSSRSPPRPSTPKHVALRRPPGSRSGTPMVHRRSSGSSESSEQSGTTRLSSSDLLAMGFLPPSKWMFLRHLNLAENGLTHISAASLAPVASTLQSLDLSGNLFTEIPDALASLTHLRALTLSNCMIDSLQSLARHPLPAITVLSLRSNRLLSLVGIEKLYSLERLDLRDNRLHDPTELARLTGMPDITDIYVTKNPFTRTHSNWRVTIFNLFRSTPGHVNDVVIDSAEPSSAERKLLVDRVAEPARRPVVKPSVEEVGSMLPSTSHTPSDERGHRSSSERTPHRGHYRSHSDTVGAISTPRRKKAPRRRIVDLAQADHKPASPRHAEDEAAVPKKTEQFSGPKTPDAHTSFLVTPNRTPFHTAPTQQPLRTPLALRPKLDTAFNSPTPAPKIRNASDDDDDDHHIPSDSALPKDDIEPHTELFKHNIEAAQHDLNTPWLSTLPSERSSDLIPRQRSISPSSRMPEQASPHRTLSTQLND